MGNFNKDDFKLDKIIYKWYRFVVSGESANYLKKYYKLKYDNVKVVIFIVENNINGYVYSVNFHPDTHDLDNDCIKELVNIGILKRWYDGYC